MACAINSSAINACLCAPQRSAVLARLKRSLHPDKPPTAPVFSGGFAGGSTWPDASPQTVIVTVTASINGVVGSQQLDVTKTANIIVAAANLRIKPDDTIVKASNLRIVPE